MAGELPVGDLEALLAAFVDYERALAQNDLAALDAAFLPGPTTIRGDGAGVLVGHSSISGFRSTRGAIAQRRIRSLHVRVINPDNALIMAQNETASGGVGLVTQLWTRSGPTWLISAAQVGAPVAPPA
jgi:amidase